MSAVTNSIGFAEAAERFYGLYPAMVSDTLDPDHKARIKVSLPWIAADFVTEWAPVAQLYAGDGYGSYWVPETDDQVIVAFLHGELRRPIVLGCLYSAVRAPHATRNSSSDPKYLRTRAGHMLLMEDGAGQRVELNDASGKNSIVIDTEANTITINAAADITVSAGANLTLNADADIAISAGGSVNVSGTTINLN